MLETRDAEFSGGGMVTALDGGGRGREGKGAEEEEAGHVIRHFEE